MPDSVTSSGQKATKGDFGFRYGATVPRPMLVDFMRQPETKIMRNGRELDLEEIQDMAKEGKNETRLRLSKIGVETVRGNTEVVRVPLFAQYRHLSLNPKPAIRNPKP